MLIYSSVPSPSDLMAQMVPCSSSDYGQGEDIYYDSQVPSPTLSYTTSYWCESNRSPALYHAHSPTPPAPPAGAQQQQQQQQQQSLPSLCFDSSAASLEELLNEYSYYDVTKEPLKELLKKEPAAAAAAAVVAAAVAEEHVLLRQCLQHPPSDLDLVHQLGSAIVYPDLLNSFSSFTMKSEKVEDCCLSSSSSSSSSASSSSSSSSSSAGLASVLNLVMEQINEEVRSTCHILGLSPNPSAWSKDDVKGWLSWTCRQCNLGPLPLERFHMEGESLVALTEEEFRLAAPQGGDTLYAKLDIWRSAWNQRSAPVTLPTIQVSGAWNIDSVNGTQETQQQQQMTTLLSASSPHQLLAVPSPSSSFHRGRASPYSDHTHSGSEDFTSEVEEMEEEDDTEHRPMAAGVSTAGSGGSHIHLWQFLKELLSQTEAHGSAIRWLDRPRGVFKIEDSVRVARLWGKRKNRPAMNYDKLSRSIRQYYRKGIMKKTERSQRLVYQFCHPYAL